MQDVDLTLEGMFLNKNRDIIEDKKSEYAISKKHIRDNLMFSNLSFFIHDTSSNRHRSFDILKDVVYEVIESDRDLDIKEFPRGSLTKIRDYREMYECERLDRCERCGRLNILNECPSCEKVFETERIIKYLKEGKANYERWGDNSFTRII